MVHNRWMNRQVTYRGGCLTLKTQMVICKSKQNKFEGDLKIKLHSKRYPTESFKYLVVKVDIKLTSQCVLSNKLNRANVLLFKIRKYVSLKILSSMYFSIFDSYLSYYYLA